MIYIIKKILINNRFLHKISMTVYLLFQECKVILCKFISIAFILLPVENNKLVFCNYYGKGFGDNGKYITIELIKNYEQYDIVWLINSTADISMFPASVRLVKYGSIKGIYEMATAKVWIDNSRKFFSPIKKKSQKYIQTWHGSISLKKIEKDAQNDLSRFYIRNAKRDSRMADLFISNGDFATKMYKTSFWYDKCIKEIGSPRNDILFNANKYNTDNVRKTFGIDNSKKYILYAPTFRDSVNLEFYHKSLEKLKDKMNEFYNEDWNILVRLHPNISKLSTNIDFSKNVIDVTSYDDMYELMAIADILITDYSSTMFEFSLTKKPVFLFTTDIEEYKLRRNFYFDLEKLPFSISRNEEELLKKMLNFNYKEYKRNLISFWNLTGVIEDGTASKSLTHIISNMTKSF